MPNPADELIESAAQAHAEGRLADAGRLARNALESNPSDKRALLLVGIVAFKNSAPAEAIPFLSRAFEADPSSFDAAFWLSMSLRKVGRTQEALAMAHKALSFNPSSEHALNQLGMCLLDVKRPEDATRAFVEAIRLAPRVAPFFDNLGRAFQALGRNDDAVAAYRQALAIGPVRPQSLFKLGDSLMSIPEPDGAAQCAREMLRLEPNSASGNLLLARALIGAGQVAEGAEHALKAMQLSPGNAAPVAYYGRALQSLGEIERADAQFKRSIELDPRQGFAYYALVHNHKVSESERALVTTMREMARDPALPRRELIQLEYGLGKALEDLGDYEEAMSHFDRANAIDHGLKVGVKPFDREALAGTIDFLAKTFTSGCFEVFKSIGLESQTPIFVVGMMRSGTTLAEQILSSHPEVGGAGEQLFWPENAGSSEKIFSPHANGRADLNTVRLEKLAAEYLDLLERLAPEKSRVVDKMNTNYLLLGILHIAFPHAKIVHMKRHPIDTCLSIWATPVANGIDLCGSKENVVFAYRQYLRLMQHWREVLPADSILEVQYEELVTDQERLTRKMIEFCGLPWDEVCLKPEENKRSVKTPSVWQVRQPVYRTSMARWRKYEPWLGAFGDLQQPSS